MANASSKNLPKSGDTMRCDSCGMEIRVETDCNSSGAQPRFECCGQPLSRR